MVNPARDLDMSGLLPGKNGFETTFLVLSPSRTVLELASRIVMKFAAGSVADDLEQDFHHDRAQDAHAQNANHGVVTLPVHMRTLRSVLRPAGVQSVGRHNTTQVTETRDQGGGGCNADFTMTLLEDLGCPSHADGDCWAKTEADHEQAAVPSPAVVGCQSRSQKTSDLDADCSREEKGSGTVKTIRDRGHKQDRNKIHLEILGIFCLGIEKSDLQSRSARRAG